MENSTILIVTPSLDQTGGVEQYYNIMSFDRESNIKYFDLQNRNRNKIFRLISSYTAFIAEIASVDTVVLNPSLNGKSFLRDALFVLLTKIKNKKLAIFWHGWDDTLEIRIKKNYFLRLFFKNTFGRADGFVVLGEIFRKKLISLGVRKDALFHREVMSISKQWIEEFNIQDKIENKQTQPQNTLNLLFLSRLMKEKGVYICVDTFSLLLNKYSEMRFLMHIAGDGEELEKLREYVKKNEIPNVFFYGDIRGDDKFNLLKSCDLFLFPTYHGEGFPNVIVEALFFGLPVITRPIAAIPDMVEHGVNGYLTTGKGVEDFLPHVETYLALSLEEKTKMSACCHLNAKSEYEVTKNRKKTLDFYNSL
jgi:glycosyltransferase involved in cell wall biosynthesis